MAMRLSTGCANGLMNGSGFFEQFNYGVLRVFSGTQPTDADSAETGTLLAEFTANSGVFTPGSNTNGLEFDAPVDGVISKKTSQTWSSLPVASGTAGWGRFYDNSRTTGSSTTAKRFDMACGVGTGEIRLSSTTITAGKTITIDSVAFTQPKS